MEDDIFDGSFASKLIQKLFPAFLAIRHKIQKLDVFFNIPRVFREILPIPSMSFHLLDDVNFNIVIFLCLTFFGPAFIAKIFLRCWFLLMYVCKPNYSTDQFTLSTTCTIGSWEIFVNHSDGHVVGIDLLRGSLLILVRKGL